MKYLFRGVGAEELSFKLNRVKLEGNKIDIKPQFSRQVRRLKTNDKLLFLSLSIAVESTEAEPKPYDIHVTLVGTFEVEDIPAGSPAEREMVIAGTQLLYPYLRAAVTNLTASAYIAPLNLPVVTGPLFREDAEASKPHYAFVVDNENNNNLN